MVQPMIISGGQTGVDRAALDFALDYNFKCGGYCPKDRLSERGRIPDKYPLTETPGREYIERTEMNVKASDAVLILKDSVGIKGGTMDTIKMCKIHAKPYYILDIDVFNAGILEDLTAWLKANNAETLNIAGNRESISPGIERKTYAFLEKLFAPVVHKNL